MINTGSFPGFAIGLVAIYLTFKKKDKLAGLGWASLVVIWCVLGFIKALTSKEFLPEGQCILFLIVGIFGISAIMFSSFFFSSFFFRKNKNREAVYGYIFSSIIWCFLYYLIS